MGYQNIALPKQRQFNLLTPTFKNIGEKPTIDLTDILVVKPGSEAFTSKKKVVVQKMNLETGALTTMYSYTTAGNKWINLEENRDVLNGEVTFSSGEAMCVNNADTAGDALAFLFSGEVELTPISINVAPRNYTLVGNFTPVSVDLTAIVPKGENGTELGTSKKKIVIQKMDIANGSLGTMYSYTTAGNKWINLEKNSEAVLGEVVFEPGEAMCVNNGDTSKTITLTFPKPTSTKK